MNPATALLMLRVLDLLIAGATIGTSLRERTAAASARIKVMIEEDRNPTPEEWAELVSETDDLTAAFRAAVEAKTAPAVPAALAETEIDPA